MATQYAFLAEAVHLLCELGNTVARVQELSQQLEITQQKLDQLKKEQHVTYIPIYVGVSVRGIMVLRHSKPVSPLEDTLTRLIAQDCGVKPEEVTTEFIRTRRAELEARPDYQYTGVAPGLRVYNKDQIAEITKQADDFLAQFRAA